MFQILSVRSKHEIKLTVFVFSGDIDRHRTSVLPLQLNSILGR